MSQASDGQGPQPCCAVSGNTLSASEPRFPQLYTEGSNQLGGGFQILRYPEGAGQLPRTPEALPDAGPGAPLLREGARPDPPAPGGHPVPLQPRPPAGAPGADRPDRAGTEPEGPQPRGPRAEPAGPGEHPLPPGEGKGGPTAGTHPRPSGWAQGTDEAHCIGTPLCPFRPCVWDTHVLGLSFLSAEWGWVTFGRGCGRGDHLRRHLLRAPGRPDVLADRRVPRRSPLGSTPPPAHRGHRP